VTALRDCEIQAGLISSFAAYPFSHVTAFEPLVIIIGSTTIYKPALARLLLQTSIYPPAASRKGLFLNSMTSLSYPRNLFFRVRDQILRSDIQVRDRATDQERHQEPNQLRAASY